MERYKKKLRIFCDLADKLAKLSTCKRRQVGAIIFPVDCSAIYAIGYNGPGRGLSNESCTESEGQCGCAHAEANALSKFNPALAKSCVLYSTSMPCVSCAPLIVNNIPPIVGLVYVTNYRNSNGFDILIRAGVQVIPRILLLDTRSDKYDDLLQQWRTLGREGR